MSHAYLSAPYHHTWGSTRLRWLTGFPVANAYLCGPAVSYSKSAYESIGGDSSPTTQGKSEDTYENLLTSRTRTCYYMNTAVVLRNEPTLHGSVPID